MKVYAKGRTRVWWLRQLALEMGDPIALEIKPPVVTSWRAQRMESGAAVATQNNALAYRRAVLTELTRLWEWSPSKPFTKVRRLPQQETELAFLSPAKIARLLAGCDQSSNGVCGVVARECPAKGVRWSEAERLTWSQVSLSAIAFERAKSGKRRSVAKLPAD